MGRASDAKKDRIVRVTEVVAVGVSSAMDDKVQSWALVRVEGRQAPRLGQEMTLREGK